MKGSYFMLCAAVSARISPECIEKVYSVNQLPCQADSPDLNIMLNLIASSVQFMKGTVIAEPGDVYNLDAWRVKSILGRDFKYPESLGERTSIELAHYVSVSGRRLIINTGENGVDGG